MSGHAKSEAMTALKMWSSWSGIGPKLRKKLTFGTGLGAIHSFLTWKVPRWYWGLLWVKWEKKDLIPQGKNGKGFVNCEVFKKHNKTGIKKIYPCRSANRLLESKRTQSCNFPPLLSRIVSPGCPSQVKTPKFLLKRRDLGLHRQWPPCPMPRPAVPPLPSHLQHLWAYST